MTGPPARNEPSPHVATLASMVMVPLRLDANTISFRLPTEPCSQSPCASPVVVEYSAERNEHFPVSKSFSRVYHVIITYFIDPSVSTQDTLTLCRCVYGMYSQ